MTNIFVYIIIGIVALYLIYDMFGEYYAMKRGWNRDIKFSRRMKWMQYIHKQDEKQIKNTMSKVTLKRKHNTNNG